ncbi:unnamed protein product [Rotaria sp. Silwood1]|nr:unnamed protein product [Rotaria sp. Silwood1]
MNQTSVLTLLHLCLSKEQRLNHDINIILFECQRLVRRHCRHSNLQNKLIITLFTLVDNSAEINRPRVWSFNKNESWWTEIVPTITDQQTVITENDTNFLVTIPVEKRICCALYSLGLSSELRAIGNLFGNGKSTVGEILHEFCATLIDLFFFRLIKFPNKNQEIEDTINGFFNKLGYPMYIGVLDGTHVVMLAVINSDLQFTYINIGASDRCNDSSVYNRSNLSEVIQHSIYQDNYMVVNNIKIQCHLIADSAFALDRTLMKPIPERPDMPRHNIIFNYRLSDVGGPSNELSVY